MKLYENRGYGSSLILCSGFSRFITSRPIKLKPSERSIKDKISKKYPKELQSKAQEFVIELFDNLNIEIITQLKSTYLLLALRFIAGQLH